MATLIVQDDKLARARMAKGMSLRALSMEIPKMAYARLWHAERGYPVMPATARRIADALGLEIMDLFTPATREEANAQVLRLDRERRERRRNV